MKKNDISMYKPSEEKDTSPKIEFFEQMKERAIKDIKKFLKEKEELERRHRDMINNSRHEIIMDVTNTSSNYPLMNEVKSISQRVDGLCEHISPRKRKNELFILNIKNKSLSRDTDSRTYTYKFSEKGMNFKLITLLLNHDSFRQTRHIRKDIQSKSDESVRKKVSQINTLVAKNLRSKNLKLIVGESGSGYMINPELKIFIEE